MSESSSDKTKRKFIDVFSTYYWSHQVTVFYEKYSDRQLAPLHKEKITRALRQLFPETPFLYRLCLSKPIDANILHDLTSEDSQVVMPFHTMFTNTPIDYRTLKDSLERRLGCAFKVKVRYMPIWKARNYIKSVSKEDPHSLLSYFPELAHQRRMAFIGKQFVFPRTQYSLTDSL